MDYKIYYFVLKNLSYLLTIIHNGKYCSYARYDFMASCRKGESTMFEEFQQCRIDL